MSYKSRERKRRKKAAQAGAQRAHSDKTRSRYYLTKIERDCRCSSCGWKLRVGGDMVYRKAGPVTLCHPCADRDPLVDYRPSLRWERVEQTKRQGRRAAG
jgi:hypothetical protein